MSATDRALLDAYLANGGFAFVGQYRAALDAYFAFLASGQRPSAYNGADIGVLLGYVQTLQSAGLLGSAVGDRAQFFADNAAFVQGGGQIDAFGQLNANIFGGYAEALAAYYAYLENGGIPSAYTALDQTTIRAYLAALARVGATEGFLADLAGFYGDYFAFVSGGGNPDNFAGLPVPPDFPAFASALNAYAAFLAGGGLPSDYDAVDFDLLQNYLEAIVASGQLADLLGANANLLTGYFAYLATGGAPDGFSGLPLYATYVSALNAYYAYLQGGGLPSGYSALDQATIRAYLAALNDAGGLASFGSLDSFFSAYFAFVAAGNDPARFAGLPVYSQYVAALNAYYAFIADGGTPSTYTALTQAQIQTYLAALASTSGGGFANFAALNDFFVRYFAYLGEGGDPDRFTGLPGRETSGGTGGGAGDPSPQLGSVRGWQFASDGLRVARVDAKVAANGRITELTVYNPSGVTTDYSGRTADLREFGRFGDAVAWTRYYVGSANRQQNVSEHLLVGTPAFELPTTGLIEYALVGGTAPTNRNAAPGSTGWFTGDLAVAFGSAGPRVGFNFDLYSEGTGYRVQTTGGAKGAASGGLGVSADGVFENQSLGLTVIAGTGCTGYCIGQVFGGLFGKGASHAGFTYNVFDRDRNNALQGVAVFGQAGSAISGLGDPSQKAAIGGTGGGDSGGSGTQNPVFLAGDGNARVGSAGDQVAFVTANTSAAVGVATPIRTTDGVLLQADLNLEKIDIQPTASSQYQRGGSDGVLGWSRISNFGGSVTNGNRQSFVLTPFASRYAHSIWGAPSTNLPTSGLVNYDLVGWTTPTATHASDLTGSSFDGRLAIDFATLKLGLEATVDVVTDRYNLSSAGGIAAPSLAITTDPNAGRGTIFTGSLTAVDSGGRTVSRGAYVSGFLAGTGGSHVGLTYGIRTASSNTIEGTAAFRAANFASGTAVQTAAAIPNITAPIADMTTPAQGSDFAPPPPPTAEIAADWARWTSSADRDRSLSIPARVAIDPGSAAAANLPTYPLGNWITFGSTERR